VPATQYRFLAKLAKLTDPVVGTGAHGITDSFVLIFGPRGYYYELMPIWT